MFGIFGGGKKEKKKDKAKTEEEVLKTINNLSEKINELEEKIKFQETKAKGQNELAKEKLRAGDKVGAKKCLQKKKWHEEQVKTLDGAAMMLEEQKMMLDGTMSMGGVYDALKEGSKAINMASENFKVEDLDQIRDEMDDNKMAFEEKNEFFKNASVMDDPELDDELEQLENELQEEALPDVKDKKKENIVIESEPEKSKNNEEKNLEDFLMS